jgi:glycosyltransferase involved in cell wall biosynthesis
VNSRPSRIMFVSTGLSGGGAEGMLARLVTSQPRLADEIVVVSLLPDGAHADRLRAAGISVVELGLNRAANIASGTFKLARLIARTRPEIVQGWMYHGDLAALTALTLSGRRKSTQLGWSIRCSALDLSQYDLALRLTISACTRLSHRPDFIIANSKAGMETHAAIGYQARRWAVVSNGIDTDAFRPDAAARVSVRRELGLGDDAIVVAHVARVDPMKDHAGLLRAFAMLPELRALLIGTGTQQLAAPANVLRLGRRDDVARLLAAADFIASSSAFGEGFSNAVAEGMACSLPAIATDVGDAREIIGDTGLIVAPRDSAALVAAIRALAAEPPAAHAARAERARARVATRFSLARAVEDFRALYQRIARGRDRSGEPDDDVRRRPGLPLSRE